MTNIDLAEMLCVLFDLYSDRNGEFYSREEQIKFNNLALQLANAVLIDITKQSKAE